MINKNFIYIIGFILPLYSLSLRIGIEISVYKILPLIVIIATIFSPNIVTFNRLRLKEILPLLILFIIVTSVNYIIFFTNGQMLESSNYGLGDRSYYQMPIHLFTILLLFSNLFIIQNSISNKKTIHLFINGFINGNLFSIFSGIIIIAFYYSGITFDLFKIYPTNFGIRMSGLGGEPRHFSALLLAAIIIISVNIKNKNFFPIKYQKQKLVVLTLFLLLSLSSSSIVGYLIIIVYFLIRSLNNSKRIFKLVSLVIIISLSTSMSQRVRDIIDARIISRFNSGIEHILYFAPKDGLVLSMLAENPLVLIAGAGSGGTDYYVDDWDFLSTASEELTKAEIIQVVLEGEREGTISPSSFIIKYIGEYGLIGLMFLLIVIFRLRRKINNLTAYRIFTDLTYTMLLASTVVSSIFFFIYIIYISSILSVYSKRSK